MFSFKDNKVLCGMPEIIAHNCCINLWRAETITMLCHNSCYRIVSRWLHSLCNIISWVIAVHIFFYNHSDSQLLLRCKTSCLMFVWVWLSLVSTNETDNETDDAPIIQFIITCKMKFFLIIPIICMKAKPGVQQTGGIWNDISRCRY